MVKTDKIPYYGLIDALVASTSIVETDLTGRFTFVNDKFCAMTHYREEELLGKHIAMLGTKTQSSSFFLSMLERIFQGDVWTGEICMATKEKDFFWVDTTIAPIKKNDSNDAIKYVVICNNVRHSMCPSEQNREFPFEGIDGRSELQQKLLEVEKLQTIGKLTSGIAHDFNNVLGCIVGYTKMCTDLTAKVSDGEVKNEFDENLFAVQRAAERATELIGKISQYLRVETQKDITPVNPSLIVKEVVNMLRGVIPSNIKIKTSFSDVPDISINTIDLHQILTNLIVNARDAIDSHGMIKIDVQLVEITSQCTLCMEDIDSKFVQITVNDDGEGIDERQIRKIFEAFFTTKEVGKGTGLGLFAVSNILHNVGAHMIVESELGKGSAFKLLFPIFDHVEFAATAAAYLSVNEKTHDLENKSHYVLVVDDDKDNAKLVEKWLISNGQKCDVFFNSEEALLSFIRNPMRFDMVLTDNVMPKLTGVELAKVILAIREKIPIIIASGTIDDIDKHDALFDLDHVHFLRKPINFNEVTKVLVGIENAVANASSEIIL
jgi:PAS domain S-box-containing protein